MTRIYLHISHAALEFHFAREKKLTPTCYKHTSALTYNTNLCVLAQCAIVLSPGEQQLSPIACIQARKCARVHGGIHV